MNYIELVNKFWELDEAWQFTCTETRLYFYILKTANRLGWVDSWTHSDERTAANVGVSKNTLKTSRNRLAQAELITFKRGGQGHANKTRYQLLTAMPASKRTAKPAPLPAANNMPLLNKQDINQTEKETGKEKPTAFSPPTLEQVETYCQSRINSVDAQKFVDFYTAKNWMIGRNKMKDWQASVRTWEHRESEYVHPAANHNAKNVNDDERW